MAIETLSDAPRAFAAGNTVRWTYGHTDYPRSEGWALTVIFSNGKNRYKITATDDPDDEDDFLVDLENKNTKGWVPGVYIATAIFAKDAERGPGRAWTIVVSGNLIDGSPKSDNRQIYENLQAIVKGRSMPNADVEHSNINGQEITRMTSQQLREWLNYYGALVAREDRQMRIASGQASGRFTRLEF